MGFAAGRIFVRAELKNTTKATADEMVSGIRSAFDAGLANLTWMDDETRLLAKKKAAAVAEKIAYPPWIMDDDKLTAWYARLDVSSVSYFANLVAHGRWGAWRQWDDLKRPRDRTRWFMSPVDVNAYYSRSANEIVFPAGILRPPFFDPDYPTSMNYGGIGVVIGHELTHGFDDQGSRYDAEGSLKQWWPPAVRAAFVEKTTCIVDQYSQFSIHGEHVNGNQTLGENIADNGGIHEAYKAYLAWETDVNGKPGSVLPGINWNGSPLNARQLFFVSFANVWCDAQRPANAHRSLLTDVHSPHRFRVVGTVANTEGFADAFQCPAAGTGAAAAAARSGMCNVW